MNKERLLEVADRIEKTPRHFNMGHFYLYPGEEKILSFDYDEEDDTPETYDTIRQAKADAFTHRRFDCGTTACIAGFAVIMYGSEDDLATLAHSGSGWHDVACRLLDLDPDETELGAGLFYWSPPGESLGMVTAAQAAAQIRRVVAEHKGDAR